MSLHASLQSIALLVATLTVFSLVELAIPLRARTAWSARHLAPNLTLTFVTFVTNLTLNIPLLLALAWLQARHIGLLNQVQAPPLAVIAVGILAMDLSAYAAHLSLHYTPPFWRFHAVHHSDPQVDVTTTTRQHPGESLIRYLFFALFAVVGGVSPASFAVYRVWSAIHGQFEHANLRLPGPIDTLISLVFTSPNMHKVHHSQDVRLTNRNYGNIFSLWDRLFGTFVPAELGRDVDYGLDGEDLADLQTLPALLAAPFRHREGEPTGSL